MDRIFEKCEIQIEGQTISKELLLKTFGEFLTQTMDKREHNVGLVMHTGSICFDVVILIYATMFSLLSNKIRTGNIISLFSDEDIVIYKKNKRYKFKGFYDGNEIGIGDKEKKFVKLQGNITEYVPESMWGYIEPYNGDSICMDGRGIIKREQIRDDFFIEVLGYKYEDIPNILDNSFVIINERGKADFLVKNISLKFNGKNIRLLDLVTASYYTENDEIRYRGNTSRNEPVLKFTSKVSVAKKLLLSKKGKRHLGLIVLGENPISRGYFDLPQLINRKSLKYIYLCLSMDSDLGLGLLSDTEDVEIFACTKEFLLENAKKVSVEKNMHAMKLSSEVNKIINKNNKVTVIKDNGIDVEVYNAFKKDILRIKRDQYKTDEKDIFIKIACSLMNLFITAPFPMEIFYSMKESGIIAVNTPGEKLENMERLSSDFPKHLQVYVRNIINLLIEIHEKKRNNTGKYGWLSEYLRNSFQRRTAVVVYKAYYATILKQSGIFPEYLLRYLDITTANKFDNSRGYDCVVVLGDYKYEEKGFNIFRCNAAAEIVSVLYRCEKANYEFKKKEYQKRNVQLQKNSTIHVKVADDGKSITNTENRANDFEKEMEEFVSDVDLTYSSINNRSNTGYEGSINTDIIAVALFDDDTKAYFSKHYKGYVLNEAVGVVKELEAQEFCEGDSIVFTKRNDDTKDIVSAVLIKMISENKLKKTAKEDYIKSNLWKNSLVEYMNKKELTARKIAELMIEDGVNVHEQTIVNWIDEDSHTVGPRDIDSIRHIGNITGIEELKNNPEIIFEACRNIRAIRRKILEQIGNAIVDKLSGRTYKTSSNMEFILNKIDSIAEIKRIEHIKRVEMTVPIGMANRPISY